VEDDRGARLVDCHPAAGQRVEVLLPARRPLFVRQPDAGTEIELPAGSQVQLAGLAVRAPVARARGAEHVAFGRLFARPFDEHAVAAYRVRPDEEIAEERAPTDWTWVRRGVGLGAIVVGGTAATLTAFAARERDGVGPSTTGLERSQVNRRIDRLNAAAVTCYAVAGAAALGYLAWTLWPRRSVEIRLQPATAPQVQLSIGWR
jgi:hypothetical protein